jgi:hypothetical protein
MADDTDALMDFVERIEAAGLPYMVTGSVAAYFYGLNRMTADTDVVVDIRRQQVSRPAARVRRRRVRRPRGSR